MNVDGVLLLYHHPLERSAATIMEHVDSFARHSRFPVFAVNTELQAPRALRQLDFSVVVLHYSLFGTGGYHLDAAALDAVTRRPDALRVAFFQDEMHFCHQRFSFIRDADVRWIYTLLEPAHWADVYGKHTPGRRLLYTIPGYVSDELLALRRFALPAQQRHIDVGYRGRQLPAYLGRGAQEKHEIGVRFLERAAGTGLTLDIDTTEQRRLYGDAWHRFLGACRATLGVEAGTSIFDIDDEVRLALEAWQRHGARGSFDEEHRALLERYEGKIFYRTVSPRHFEAAALGTVQILYPGRYSGVLDPARHGVVLDKDFGNFDDVLRTLRSPDRMRDIAATAARDLIDSGAFTYQRFIASFDDELAQAGVALGLSEPQHRRVTAMLEDDLPRRLAIARARAAAFRAMAAPFPGRELVRRVARPLRPLWRALLRRR